MKQTILNQLEIYITAQKTIANYFMLLGVLLIILAVLFYFVGTNSLFNGLKIGFLILGFISIVSGYAYRITEEKLLKKQIVLYHNYSSQFHRIERIRMEKVVKNFPVYQMVSIGIIIISLIVIFFDKNNFLHGILFSVIIYFLGNMIIEKVSKPYIDKYYEQVLNS